MDQLSSIFAQSTDPGFAAFNPPISTATPTLSGFATPIGGSTASEHEPRTHWLLGVPLPQQLQQPDIRGTKVVIPGRVTGPVRLIQQLARAWDLTNAELASLLAYPSPRLAGDLLSGKLTFSGNEDRADRARLLYRIHFTLSNLFLNEGDEKYWIRRGNPILKGESPLSVMMVRRIPGMLMVRQMIEQHLANR